jgi:hypothetical protein
LSEKLDSGITKHKRRRSLDAFPRNITFPL